MSKYQFPSSGAISLGNFRPYCFSTSQSVEMRRITRRWNEQNENQSAYIGNPQRNGDNLPWNANTQRNDGYPNDNNDDIVLTGTTSPSTPQVSLSTYYNAIAEFWTSQPNKYMWNWRTRPDGAGVVQGKDFAPYIQVVIFWENSTYTINTTSTQFGGPATVSYGGLTYGKGISTGFGFDPYRSNGAAVFRY